MGMRLSWFRFYSADYLAHTMRLETVSHGAMIQLLIHYWQHGALPSGDEEKMRLVGIDDAGEWQHIAASIRDISPGPTLKYLFSADWSNPFMDELRRRGQAEYAAKLQHLRSLDERRLPPEEWAIVRVRIFERDNYTCGYCSVRGGDMECDHRIPICQGGSNDDDNLITACMPCNRDKGGRTVEQWRRT